ncbi:MAG: hypothetical protein JWM82_2851 [Myxococcales bacterium]|nr:hypothetical protein [Myxococcales bacterium]
MTTRCSRDLKQIVDGCDGHVVTTCGAGEGCGAKGTCVPACQAAATAQGSLGCDFIALPPDGTGSNIAGSCFATFVGNTWNEPISIHVDYDNQEQDATGSIYLPVVSGSTITYDLLNGKLAPGKTAIIFMAQAQKQNGPFNYFVACPSGVKPILSVDPIKHGTARTKSFRVRSDAPISAYSIWPYGGAVSYAPSAMLLLPTASLGSRYLLVDAWIFAPGSTEGPRAQIVANEDATEIKLTPTINLNDGDHLTGAAAGQTATYTLNRGEVLQFASLLELNGSKLESNKPIAVFGGNSCMNIPEGVAACDAASQQLPAVSQWGNEYVGVRYRSRSGKAAGDGESVPWRVIAAVDGTVLTYDPEPPPKAPASLAGGEAATFWTGRPFTVRSQDNAHPIFMSAFMTGGADYLGLGDPEFVNVVPSDQYLDHYVFFADVTYKETSLVLVRRKTKDGFKDVTLDCAGVIPDWQPVGASGDFEYTRVDLSVGGAPAKSGKGECSLGGHEMSSDGPFTATVWGWDNYASYAYPTGTGIRPLNDFTFPVK